MAGHSADGTVTTAVVANRSPANGWLIGPRNSSVVLMMPFLPSRIRHAYTRISGFSWSASTSNSNSWSSYRFTLNASTDASGKANTSITIIATVAIVKVVHRTFQNVGSI